MRKIGFFRRRKNVKHVNLMHLIARDRHFQFLRFRAWQDKVKAGKFTTGEHQTIRAAMQRKVAKSSKRFYAYMRGQENYYFAQRKAAEQS